MGLEKTACFRGVRTVSTHAPKKVLPLKRASSGLSGPRNVVKLTRKSKKQRQVLGIMPTRIGLVPIRFDTSMGLISTLGGVPKRVSVCVVATPWIARGGG